MRQTRLSFLTMLVWVMKNENVSHIHCWVGKRLAHDMKKRNSLFGQGVNYENVSHWPGWGKMKMCHTYIVELEKDWPMIIANETHQFVWSGGELYENVSHWPGWWLMKLCQTCRCCSVGLGKHVAICFFSGCLTTLPRLIRDKRIFLDPH